MNNNFLTWLVVAGAAALGLLLLLGGTAEETTIVDGSEAVAVIEPSAYWEPVTLNEPVVPVERVVQAPPVASSGCTSCGTVVSQPIPTPAVQHPMPCSACGVPVRQAAPVPAVSPCAAAAVPVASVSGCGGPVTACPSAPCPQMVQPCSACNACGPCADTCPTGVRPGINRNMDLCVDECTFIQLHATVPQPICDQVSFYWEATKGEFLDPTAAAPIYYAPATQFPAGEEVWVILTVTDATGARYNDQVKIHITNEK